MSAGQQGDLKGPETRGVNNVFEMVTEEGHWRADVGPRKDKGQAKALCDHPAEASRCARPPPIPASRLRDAGQQSPQGGERASVAKLRPRRAACWHLECVSLGSVTALREDPVQVPPAEGEEMAPGSFQLHRVSLGAR